MNCTRLAVLPVLALEGDVTLDTAELLLSAIASRSSRVSTPGSGGRCDAGCMGFSCSLVDGSVSVGTAKGSAWAPGRTRFCKGRRVA